jgi:putative spermidine/putrescine transport system permease protein
MRVLNSITTVVIVLMVLPLLVVAPLSFSSSSLLSLPIPGWSMQWYAAFIHDPRWLAATRTSFLVGGLTVLAATPLGTLAALGLHFGRFPGRRLMLAAMLAPVVTPSVITGLAMYLAFARVGLTNTLPGLVLAHTVLGAPYSVAAVLAGLQGIDGSLLLAARGLGAPPRAVLRRVLAPLLAPGIAAGAVFAFAISFDELVITLFLAGPDQQTLPRQMFAGLRETLSPTLAAAACVLGLFSLALLGLWQIVRGRQAE